MQPLRQVGLATGTLTTEEVNYIDRAIVKTALPALVGRNLMPAEYLPHAGFLKHTFYTENDMAQAIVSMTGEEESEDLVDLTSHEVKIPIIAKYYTLHWRDVLMRRNNGEDLNTQHAENAARQVAEEEDIMIITGEYTGGPYLGIEGLATSTGRLTTAGGDWSANNLTYIATAKQLLRAQGFYGPYRLIVRSTWYAQLEALISNLDKWYFQAIGELIGGVQNILVSDSLYTSAGGTDNALLVDIQPDNFKLIIGADISNYLTQLPSMNYKGKVWEAVVPEIRRPKAICEITSLT